MSFSATHLIGFGSASPAVAAGEDYTTGLMGWWKLNENTGTSAADSSGNGHTGTLTSAGWGTGYEGSALNAAATRHVAITDHADLRPTTALTYHCRIYYTGTLTGYPFPLEKSAPGNGYGYYVNNGASIGAYIGSEGDIFTGSIPSSGAWHSITATADGSDFILYLDGVEVDRKTRSGAIPQNTSAAELVIGARSDYSSGWPGLVDDARIYNRALTAAQIAALHASDGTT